MTCILVIVFTGCTSCAPSGFYRGPSPIVYDGEEWNIITIVTQFPELNNIETLAEGKMYFLYNDKIHFIEIERAQNNYLSHVNIATFSEHEKIGEFIEILKEWRTSGNTAIFNMIFLHTNHLYYQFIREEWGFYFSHNMRAVFKRYEFYRFNLDTGKNEEISLTQYVQTLQIFDNNFKISPDYKGER